MKWLYAIVVLLVISTGCRSHATNQRHVLLTWNPSSTPAVTYNVYRSSTHGSGYKLIATGIKYPWYKEAAPEGTYYYVVTSVDRTMRESEYSAEMKVEVKR